MHTWTWCGIQRKHPSILPNTALCFSDAATVLDGPYALTIEDRRFNEERFVTVGSDAFGRVLVVVYTYPPNLDAVRLISARRSTASEKKHYHGQS